MLEDFDVSGKQGMHFYTGESIIMDYGRYFDKKQLLKLIQT